MPSAQKSGGVDPSVTSISQSSKLMTDEELLETTSIMGSAVFEQLDSISMLAKVRSISSLLLSSLSSPPVLTPEPHSPVHTSRPLIVRTCSLPSTSARTHSCRSPPKPPAPLFTIFFRLSPFLDLTATSKSASLIPPVCPFPPLFPFATSPAQKARQSRSYRSRGRSQLPTQRSP
jgi:hypothetical protein